MEEQADLVSEAADQLRKTVTVKIWIKNGSTPIILPTYTPTYPLFKIEFCLPFLHHILKGNTSALVATYDPISTQWQYHNTSTVRQVHRNGVVLYCLLPSGLEGGRIIDCPGLDDDISAYNPHQQPSTTSMPRSWPTDYLFDEVVPGLQQLKQPHPSKNIKSRYHEVFSDAMNYASSTLGRHFRILANAEEMGLIALGWSGKWSDFASSYCFPYLIIPYVSSNFYSFQFNRSIPSNYQ
ncbi:hypothetical protein F5050DRAFT_1811974 [Lentinula boryana]|uniref:Uncharacterized protein n=1 Tax=Lentinula boryana TaxID=40481 RepID=A0ABQ8Q011_9AGAR|nr:hypothetical protein F5050DRAFT_1811974 [Lentinula boryana]